MPRNPDAYVRSMQPAELPQVIDVLALAFINDPTMCYYGNWPALIPDPAHRTRAHDKALRGLRHFWNAMAQMPLLTGGNIDVVVVPNSDPILAGAERVIGVALWIAPGSMLDVSLPAIFRAGWYKVAFAWGYTGLKRLDDYTPAVEKVLRRELEGRSVPRLDTWHVWSLAVDPDHQGAGYSTMLFEHGFRRASPKVVHIVASKPKNKDIYEHFGFETVETHMAGVGEVDAAGLPATGDAAKGVPEFVMIKWST